MNVVTGRMISSVVSCLPWTPNSSTEPSTTIWRKSGKSPSAIRVTCCGKRCKNAALTSSSKFASLMSQNSGSARMSFQSVWRTVHPQVRAFAKNVACLNRKPRPSIDNYQIEVILTTVSYTHLRAHETVLDLVCRLLLEKKKK